MSRPATAPLPVTLPPIPLADRCVIKRDGTLVPWDAAKITRAVALAFHEVQHGGAANPDRDNPAGRHGLDAATFAKVRHIVQRVASHEVRLMSQLLKYLKPGALLDGRTCGYTLYDKWWPIARSDSFVLGETVYTSIE